MVASTASSVPILPLPLTEEALAVSPTPAAPSSSSSSSGSGSRLKATHHLSSGGLSGFVSAVSLQPLDLLKTRVQQAYAADSEVKLVKGAKR